MLLLPVPPSHEFCLLSVRLIVGSGGVAGRGVVVPVIEVSVVFVLLVLVFLVFAVELVVIVLLR